MERAMTNQALDEILLRGTDELRALLETAFEAGRTSEREAMKRRMEQFFENVNHWTEVHNKIVPPKPEQPRPEGRAPLGSVKPARASLRRPKAASPPATSLSRPGSKRTPSEGLYQP
jgi:hypothetical protein